jgi:hypothetical protein
MGWMLGIRLHYVLKLNSHAIAHRNGESYTESEARLIQRQNCWNIITKQLPTAMEGGSLVNFTIYIIPQ